MARQRCAYDRDLADFSHPWFMPGILGDPNQAESPAITLTETKGGFQYEIDTPVNKFVPTARRNSCTVILPFMVTIQRRQPESVERHTNIYLCTPVSNHETKFYRLAGRNYRDGRPTRSSTRSTGASSSKTRESSNRNVRRNCPSILPRSCTCAARIPRSGISPAP